MKQDSIPFLLCWRWHVINGKHKFVRGKERGTEHQRRPYTEFHSCLILCVCTPAITVGVQHGESDGSQWRCDQLRFIYSLPHLPCFRHCGRWWRREINVIRSMSVIAGHKRQQDRSPQEGQTLAACFWKNSFLLA